MISHQLPSLADRTNPTVTLSPRFNEPTTLLFADDLEWTGNSSTFTVAWGAAYSAIAPSQMGVINRKAVPASLSRLPADLP